MKDEINKIYVFEWRVKIMKHRADGWGLNLIPAGNVTLLEIILYTHRFFSSTHKNTRLLWTSFIGSWTLCVKIPQ